MKLNASFYCQANTSEMQQAAVAANSALDDVLLHTYIPISDLGLPLHQQYLELAPNDARGA